MINTQIEKIKEKFYPQDYDPVIVSILEAVFTKGTGNNNLRLAPFEQPVVEAGVKELSTYIQENYVSKHKMRDVFEELGKYMRYDANKGEFRIYDRVYEAIRGEYLSKTQEEGGKQE